MGINLTFKGWAKARPAGGWPFGPCPCQACGIPVFWFAGRWAERIDARPAPFVYLTHTHGGR